MTHLLGIAIVTIVRLIDFLILYSFFIRKVPTIQVIAVGLFSTLGLAFVHEGGHALSTILLGYHVAGFTAMGGLYGGYVTLTIPAIVNLPKLDQLTIALSGPLVSGILSFILGVLIQKKKESNWQASNIVLYVLASIDFSLMIVLGSDGYIVRSALGYLTPHYAILLGICLGLLASVHFVLVLMHSAQSIKAMRRIQSP